MSGDGLLTYAGSGWYAWRHPEHSSAASGGPVEAAATTTAHTNRCPFVPVAGSSSSRTITNRTRAAHVAALHVRNQLQAGAGSWPRTENVADRSPGTRAPAPHTVKYNADNKHTDQRGAKQQPKFGNRSLHAPIAVVQCDPWQHTSCTSGNDTQAVEQVPHTEHPITPYLPEETTQAMLT